MKKALNAAKKAGQVFSRLYSKFLAWSYKDGKTILNSNI